MHILAICQAKKKREIFFWRKKKKRNKLCTRSESIQTCGRKITHHVGRGRRIKSAKKQRDFSLLSAEVTSPLVHPPQRSAGFHLSQFDIPIWGPQAIALYPSAQTRGVFQRTKRTRPTNNEWCFAGRRAIHSRWIGNLLAAVDAWISCYTRDEP
jgi:hypothetical protein